MSDAKSPSVWQNPANDTRLRELWDAGFSASEIGLVLGVTKNAVIGRVHRIGLTKRASPIIAAGAKAPYPATRKPASAQSLAPLPPVPDVLQPPPAAPKTTPAPLPIATERPKPSPQVVAVAPPAVAAEPLPAPRLIRPKRTCQFIVSDGRPWRMCGKPTDGSWCEDCAARVFVQKKPAQDQAA